MPDCGNCEEPIVENGRNWIHVTGRFMCEGSGTGSYAVPMDLVSTLIDEAYIAGYRDAERDGA